MGDNEGAGRLENPSDYFTDPDVAANFVSRTGIDSLAGAASVMALIPYEIEAMKRVARNKIELFGSAGRA